MGQITHLTLYDRHYLMAGLFCVCRFVVAVVVVAAAAAAAAAGYVQYTKYRLFTAILPLILKLFGTFRV